MKYYCKTCERDIDSDDIGPGGASVGLPKRDDVGGYILPSCPYCSKKLLPSKPTKDKSDLTNADGLEDFVEEENLEDTYPFNIKNEGSHVFDGD